MSNTKNRGDRIVQIVLLILLAGGITLALLPSLTAGGSASAAPSGKGAGRPGGRSGGAAMGIAVETVTLERGDIRSSIKVNGDVTVETSVDIYPDTGGKLVSSRISLGDTVRKGQVIAAVDPSIPGQNYSTSPVSSTISGTVISLPYQVGATVSSQSAVATIGDLEDMVIVTYIPERYISALSVGLIADVNFDAYPEETFSAAVSEISPVMDTNTRTLEIKLKLGDADSRIRPGMFATMNLITEEHRDTLVVPARAVTEYYGETVLYVVNAQGKAERRSIVIGLSTDSEMEIIDGLAEGEIVITQGLNSISDGSAVRTVNKEDA